MSKLLPLFTIAFLAFGSSLSGQNFTFSRYIMQTGIIEDEGVMLTVSSDDAEQENDEIDALYDDDIDAGWEGAPEDQNILTCGMRFRNILIPHGAIIDSAFIIVYSHEDKSAEDVAELTVYGDDTDDAVTFTEDMLIDARPSTTATVEWTVAEDWSIWEPYRSPDLKAIVQEIVDRSGWEAGNALAFVVLGKNQGPSDLENAREWESFENISDPEDGGDGQNHPERVPQLVIYYSISELAVEIPVMVTDTIEDEGIVFEASSDDAEQENDEIDSLFDDDLDAGWEGAPEDQNILTTGIRFRNIPVPHGAIIESAYITVWSHEDKSAEDVAEITIYGEDTDHAETFTEDALIDARPSTTATVDWTVAEEWTLWQPYQTPELKSIVQEIVDRNGWEAGNALAFVFLGKNQGPSDLENAREWESFENISDPEDGGDGQNHPERVPRLTIVFSSPSTGVQDIFPTAERLKLYPNPTGKQGTIVELENEKPAMIRVINANGQVLQNIYTEQQRKVEIRTANLPKGVYFIQANQDGRLYVEQLIVQ
ncbi:MAG TPA: T9SS type A sorting domain-containing protein [Saprospiraceae bacterium]|nr:T9SS type A sorting domain-containing protein [Saprospiraceae bacterium]HMQ83596.1 T9SS type A sorting domain-containing protein [Saprospiraceae bacterium]